MIKKSKISNIQELGRKDRITGSLIYKFLVWKINKGCENQIYWRFAVVLGLLLKRLNISRTKD